MIGQKLGAVNQMEGLDYSRYWDGKNFDYGRYMDDYSRMNANLGAVNQAEAREYQHHDDQNALEYGEALLLLSEQAYNNVKSGSYTVADIDILKKSGWTAGEIIMLTD